jgi:hypothetical protein
MFNILPDIIGLLGVTIIVVTYYKLQLEKIDSKSLEYSLSNMIGSILILTSLLFNWNLSSVIIEIIWIIISLIGVVKYFKNKSEKRIE